MTGAVNVPAGVHSTCNVQRQCSGFALARGRFWQSAMAISGRREPPTRARRLVDFDLAPLLLSLRVCRLGDRDLEDAVLEGGGDIIGLDPVGKGQRALESAIGPLGPMQDVSLAFLLLLVFGLLHALDRELVVAHSDVDVIFRDAGEFGGDRDHPFVFCNVDTRREGAAHAAAKPVFEEGINLRLEAAEMLNVATAFAPWRKPGLVGHGLVSWIVVSNRCSSRVSRPRAAPHAPCAHPSRPGAWRPSPLGASLASPISP